MNINDVKKAETFWLNNGRSIKNVVELGRELQNMNEEMFKHHVNDDTNDFANWIHSCIKDEKLATLVRTTKTQKRMLSIIERHILDLTKPPKKPQVRPSIVKTKNITPLTLKGHHEKSQRKVIRSGKKTTLRLQHGKIKKEIYVHEPKNHYPWLLFTSHLTLGIVLGAIAATIILVIL